MTNFDWVKQPPVAKKVTFLVDELGPKGGYGITQDIEKINYNRQHLGVNTNLDIGIKTALSRAGGISTVVPLGRYITFIQIKDNEQEGFMWFIDFEKTLSPDEMRNLLHTTISEVMADYWLTIQAEMVANYNPEVDNWVRLLKVTAL